MGGLLNKVIIMDEKEYSLRKIRQYGLAATCVALVAGMTAIAIVGKKEPERPITRPIHTPAIVLYADKEWRDDYGQRILVRDLDGDGSYDVETVVGVTPHQWVTNVKQGYLEKLIKQLRLVTRDAKHFEGVTRDAKNLEGIQLDKH